MPSSSDELIERLVDFLASDDGAIPKYGTDEDLARRILALLQDD